MGNTASFDEVSQIKEGEKVAAPPNWNNQVDFRLISPASDLSNPSQLVKRKTGTTPHRHRLSKVATQAHLSQKRQPKTLPEPQMFYFVQHDEPEIPSQRQQHIFFRKAARAKRILLGCMSDTAKCEPKLQSKVAIKQKGQLQKEAKKAPAVPSSFQPVIRETDAPYYLHNEVSYMDRMLNVSASPPDNSLRYHSKVQETPGDVNESLAMESPVAALFPKDKIERVPSQVEKMTNKIPDVVITPSVQAKIQAQINAQAGRNSRGRNMSRRSSDTSSTRQDRIRQQHEREVEAAVKGRPVERLSKSSVRSSSVPPPQSSTLVSVKDRISAFESKDDSMGPGHIQSKASIWRDEPPKQVEENPVVQACLSGETTESSVSVEEPSIDKSSASRVDVSTCTVESQPGRIIIKKPSQMESIEEKKTLQETTNVPSKHNGVKEAAKKMGEPARAQPTKTRPIHSTGPALLQLTTGSRTQPTKSKPVQASGPALLKLAGWGTKASKPQTKHEKELPTLLKLAGWEKKDRAVQNRSKSLGAAGTSSNNYARKSDSSAPSNNAATMLKATYPIARAFTSDEILNRPDSSLIRAHTQDYRLVALGGQSPVRANENVDTDTSVMSMDTVQSVEGDTSYPILSEEALVNAGFLFSPSFAPEMSKQKKLPAPTTAAIEKKDSLGIDTYNSRHRFLISHVPMFDQQTLPTIQKTVSRDDSEKRVRFSMAAAEVIPPVNTGTRKVSEESGNKVSHVTVPAIENKMSDLTEPSTRESVGAATCESKLDEISEPRVGSFTDDRSSTDSKPQWTTSDNGVTPMRPGMRDATVTNSPFIRFNHARSKFSGDAATTVQELPQEKPKLTKVQGGGIVSSRIAALQQQFEKQGEQQSVTKIQPAKPRRDTTAHQAIAPRPAKLISSFNSWKHRGSITSPTIVNGNIINDEESSVVGTDDESCMTEDAFGEIVKSTTFEQSDEDSVEADPLEGLIQRYETANKDADSDDESESDDETEDAFATIQHQHSLEDEVSHDGTATVATVQQTSVPLFSHQRDTRGDSSSNLSSDPTVSTVRPQRLSMASSAASTVVAYPEKSNSFKFRDTAPVRPNEQLHRALPGSKSLSPMQKVPTIATKWRAMAAAAQEREQKRNPWKAGGLPKKTLGERNLNLASGR